MVSKKFLKVTVHMVLLGVIVMLLGCGLFGQSAVYAEPKGEITIWGWPTHDKAYEAMIEGFNAKYPDVEVTWQMIPGRAEGLRDALSTALAAGQGLPDVTAIETNDISRFMMQGGFVDLLQPPYDAGKYEADFVPYKWAQATAPNGELFALPWDIGPASVIYRRDLFEEAGLPSDPESVAKMMSTWEDFIETGKKVVDPAQGKFLLVDASQIPYIYHARRNFFDENYKVAINDAKTLSVLQYAKQIRELGLDAKVPMWSQEWNAMLANGDILATIIGCWFGGFLKTAIDPDGAGNWGIIPVPEDPLQNWGGSFLAIPEKAANKEAAWAFVEYALATVKGQNDVFKAVDYFPAYMPAWQESFYQEGDPYFGGQKTRAVWMDIATSPGKYISTPMDAIAEQVYTAEVTKMLNEGLDPTETLKTIENAISEQTAQDRDALLKLIGKQ